MQRDRLSELPLEVRQHILSFVPTFDAIHTSFLSSDWRHTWKNLDIFDFGFNDYLQWRITLCEAGNSIFNVEDVRFVMCLDLILESLKKSQVEGHVIKKLDIYVPTLPSDLANYRIDVYRKWLAFADKAEELLFSCEYYMSHSLRNYPSILTSTYLVKLLLHGCDLTNTDDTIVINLPRLRQLRLCCVKIDQRMLDAFLASCVALQELDLFECRGIKEVRLTGHHPKLITLKVGMHDYFNKGRKRLDRVDICTNQTELRYLSLDWLGTNYLLSVSCSNLLVDLTLNYCGVGDNFFNNVAEFSNLRCLRLHHCPNLWRINIKAYRLTHLTIEFCSNLQEVELRAPDLLSFTYATHSNKIMSLVSAHPLASLTLTSLDLRRPPNSTTTTLYSWDYSRLVALLANFTHSQALNLTTDAKENVIIPRKLRGRLSPPLCGVAHLALTTTIPLKVDVLRYFDALLWLSPHPRTISLRDEKLNFELSVELHYDDGMKEGESCGCYPTKPINCWKHSLKDFRVVRELCKTRSD